MAVSQSGSISLGDILAGAASAIGHNALVTLGAAALLVALPQVGWSYLMAGMMHDQMAAQMAAANAGHPVFPFATMRLTLLGGLVFLALGAILNVVIIRVVAADRQGLRADLAGALAVGARLALPLIGLMILIYIGMMIGFMLLVVPGIIVATMWAVAPAALVEERCGVIDAFGRSRALTKGHRWKVFGLAILTFLLLWALTAVAGLVTVGSMSFLQIAQMRTAGTLPFAYIALNAILNTVGMAFFIAVFAQLYFALRTAQEGPEASELASIFA